MRNDIRGEFRISSLDDDKCRGGDTIIEISLKGNDPQVLTKGIYELLKTLLEKQMGVKQ